MFKNTVFGSQLANNNGCGQYALIGVRLLFEGADYNHSRSGRRGLLFEGGDYSRAASDRGNTVCPQRGSLHVDTAAMDDGN